MPVNQYRLTDTFTSLVRIDAPSFDERAMADELIRRLAALGIPVSEDGTAAKIHGTAGNLIARLPGTVDAPPLLFSSHLDTVEPAKGKQPILHPDGRITSDGSTVLGADDAAGLTAILEALTVLQEDGIPHRPLELVFPVAEEPYTAGSSQMDFSLFQAQQAYVLDMHGNPGTAALTAPSILYFRVTIHGKSAHAGMAPETGVHAIAIAGKVLAALQEGAVDDKTTVNVGTIQGGLGTNIVPDTCILEGEVRGFDHALALQHLEEIRALFTQTAESSGGTVEFHSEVRTIAYHEEEDAPVVQRLRRACESEGLSFQPGKTFGGSDNNTFEAHGIHGIVLASAMHEIHTTREYTTVEGLTALARLTLALMTDTE